MRRILLVLVAFLGSYSGLAYSEQMPGGQDYTNSIGMKFVRIEPGEFQMGQLKRLVPEVLPLIEGGDRGGRFDLLADGDYDEKPVHKVTITRPFYMATCEVTNKQYELFDPAHSRVRGKYELSTDDDEAVIYVNWYDAMQYCQWLSDIEGIPYRLPTEAEWEYACRAGTETNYSMGDLLPKEFHNKVGNQGRVQAKVNVGRTAPNPWGLYDMHGNVEEWCYDWYGPYQKKTQKDPVGYVDGDFRVARGGSYGTFEYFLRSANRMATLPEERQWATGFRVVIGELAKTKPLKLPAKPDHQQNVIQRDQEVVKQGPGSDKPYFKGPRKYMKIARGAIGPLFAGHNHSPHIAACPNGDLLATWFTCVSEKDREMGRGGSRLRWGNEEWDDASVFWDAPDRNDSVCALWTDEKDKMYHFVGTDVGATYAYHSLGLRTSTDSGATWSKVRIFNPEHSSPPPHRAGHWLSGPVFRTNDGGIAFVTDGWPTLWYSHDGGLTWQGCEGNIKGNHPGVVQLRDGRMLGFTRGGDLRGAIIVTQYDDLGKTRVHSNENRPYWMPKCVSDDLGKTWKKTPSIFNDIGGGQRLAMMRLKEGPIFFASFADRGIIITDKAGKKREVRGLFAAVSEDEGETWSTVKLVTDDGPGKPGMTTNGGCFAFSQRNSEYRGYMSVCQAPNGLIHLITSFSHYAFNLAWLKTPNELLKYPPLRVKHEVETFDGPEFDLDGWEPYHGHAGGFNGKGQYTMISRSHFQGMNRLIGEGSFEVNMAFENISYNPRGDTASPGITIWFKDAMMRRLHFYVRDDRIDMGLADEEDPVRMRWPGAVKCDKPPTSAKLRFTYDEKAKQIRIFYGINGAEAVTELPHSKAGIYLGKPYSESTAVYIMMSNGQVDLDYFEIKPAESDTSKPATRVLHFPKDRSLGRIMVKDADIIKGNIQKHQDWYQRGEPIGEAQGDVVIPAGKKAALVINKKAAKDFSPITNLKPDDLYMLSLLLLDQSVSDKFMSYLLHLTGLKYLWLTGVRTTTEGMKHIAKLQSLEMLVPPKGVTNRGLSYVAQLESLRKLVFAPNRVTNTGLVRYLPKLTKLEELALYGEHISDAGLVCLADLPRLRSLSLNSGNFTDAGLFHLKNISTLKALDLNHLPITDEGLRRLSGLTGLEKLTLHDTNITDQGLAYLRSMSSLKDLNIGKINNMVDGKPQITDAGMVHIAELKELEHLTIPGITDRGIEHIAKLKKLKYFRGGGSTDTALEHISKLQYLEYLNTGSSGYTDAGMSHLAKLTNLKDLRLSADSITNEGLAKLKTLKSLEILGLDCKNITFAGLSCLNELPNLIDLQVESVRQDESVLDISGLTKLEDLRLCGRTPIHILDKDLACLENLKKLRHLAWLPRDSMVTDAGIAYLKDLPNMRELYCGSPYLTDKSLSYLANTKTLNSLTIIGNFTDEGLGLLEELKALRHLEIDTTNKFSPAAIRQLKERLPNLGSFSAGQNRELKNLPQTSRNPSTNNAVAPSFVLKTLDGKVSSSKTGAAR